MKEQIGLEFEFSASLNQADMAEVLNRNGIVARATSQVSPQWWAVSRDGTIDRHANGCNQIELKAPPLRVQDLGTIRKVLDTIKANCDTAVNVSCGLHCHVEVLSWAVIKNVYLLWNHFEPEIISFLPMARRANGMTRQIRPRWEGIWRNVRNDHRPDERYLMVNSHCFQKYGTVEFRGHSGTLNYNKVKRWVLFCARLVEIAREFQTWKELDAYLKFYKPGLFDLFDMNGKTRRYLEGRKATHAKRGSTYGRYLKRCDL